MRNDFSTLIFFVFILAAFCQPSPYVLAASELPVWSNAAVPLYGNETRHFEVAAPDGTKVAVIDGVSLSVVAYGNRLPGIEHAGVSTLAELSWAPDSSAFFITESYGGAVGDWHVTVFMVTGGSVSRVNVGNNVMKSFMMHYRCEEPEEPNIGGIKWLNNGRQLLLAAEVPPHSTCPEMGKVMGYIVDIPSGKILQEFRDKALKDDWGQFLGQRFPK